MAGGIGNFWGAKLLDKLLGAQDFTPPATWYAAAFTSTPTDAGSGTEVSAPGYSRIAITNNTVSFPSASGLAVMVMAVDIDFGVAAAPWGTVTHIGFFDALTSGHLGPWMPLSVGKVVNAGGPFKIIAGNGTFTAV